MQFTPLPKSCHPDFTRKGKKPTGPVEIDWANPLTAGLKIALIDVDGGGYINLVDSTKVSDTRVKKTKNIALYDTDLPTNRAQFAAADYITDKDRFSFVFRVRPENLTADHGLVSFIDTDWELLVWLDTFSSQLRVGFGVDHLSPDIDYTSTGITTDSINAITVVKDGATDAKILVDNEMTSFATKAMASLTNATIDLFKRTSTTAEGFEGESEVVYMFDRVLSETEMRSLNADPYQILKPAVDVYAFWAAGGGPSTQTVTGSLSAILQKQGIAKQATLSAILQRQGLTLNSSVDALLQKSVDITGEIDAILQKLGITSVASIDALLQKSVTASASLDAILTAITSSTETVSIDAILKKLGITSTASLDSILQKQGLNVSASLSALLQKAVSLSSVIDAILQKTVTTSASLDAILTQAGSGSVSANFDAILRKTLSVNLSIDALLQKQDLTVYASLDALLQKRQTATASLDAILYGTASIAASLDALLKRTGVSITANLDAILTASSSFITPKNLVYVMAEDRIVTVLAEDRIVKVI